MTIFFWSDLHLGHANMYGPDGFKSKTGTGEAMRSFANSEEADQYMIDAYNRVVRSGDTVYFLGDVAIRKPGLQKLGAMRAGKKVLVMGNHDIYEHKEYRHYFAENRIKGCIMLPKEKIVLTHVPIHPLSLKKFPTVDSENRWDYNIHGHLHDWELDDPRYINVCVELTHYRPIALEELIK